MEGAFLDQPVHADIHGDDKYHKEDVCRGGADHCAGVVKAVQKHGAQIGHRQIEPPAGGISLRLAQLGPAEEHAHEYRKAKMAGNGGDRSGKGYLQAVGQHIPDIFKRSEPKRNCHGIDDAVIEVREIPIVPNTLIQEEKLGPFLDHSNDKERQ